MEKRLSFKVREASGLHRIDSERRKSDQDWHRIRARVFYRRQASLEVDKGTAVISKTDGKDSTKLGVTARKIVDHSARNRRKILAIGRDLGKTLLRPEHGRLRLGEFGAALCRIGRRMRTNEAFDWVANRLIGEVNGSHMGAVAI